MIPPSQTDQGADRFPTAIADIDVVREESIVRADVRHIEEVFKRMQIVSLESTLACSAVWTRILSELCGD